MAIAALYSLSSESAVGTPSSSAVITVAVVCDQNGMCMYESSESSSMVGSQSGLSVESHTYNL